MRKSLIWAGLIAALSFTLFASYELKRPCLEKGWGGTEKLEYRNLCYNDVQALYGVRNLDKRAFPYVVEHSYEYPVLMGLTMWSASLFAHNHVEYFYATMPLLSLMAVFCLLGLTGAIGFKRELLWFAAGTPLLFYAYLNWDLLPVACVCLAMWAWAKGNLKATGAAIGLGVAAKIYPAFLLPSLMISVWNQETDTSNKRRDLIELVGSAAVAWFAVNLPIVIAELTKTGGITGWFSVFTFHTRRHPDFGTPWYWMYVGNQNEYPAFMTLLPIVAAGWMTAWTALRDGALKHKFKLVGAGVVLTVALTWIYFAVQSGLSPDEFKSQVDRTSGLCFGLGAIALWYHQWREKRSPWTIGGAVLALYLSVSKIHSPQHTLWVLPLMIVVSVPTRTLVTYLVADALVFVGGFEWFATSPEMRINSWQVVFMVGVFMRAIALLMFSAQAVGRVEDRFARPTDNVERGSFKAAANRTKTAA